MTHQPFTWHGYRFEWDSFDMPHGSKEHYEGFSVSAPCRWNDHDVHCLPLEPDDVAAKRALVKRLQEKSSELRVESDRLAKLVEEMENDL